VLHSVSLLRGLPAAHVLQFVGELYYYTAIEHDLVIRVSETAEELFFVKEGAVEGLARGCAAPPSAH